MKISYNWLKEYLNFKDNHESIGEKLTSLGLEVEGITKFESIPGGLEGVVVGKTKSVKKHPNADRLKITTVDVGADELLQIVCGAPNVDKNQTVAVATSGTTLYPNNEKIKIKKSKIRGEISNGMICGQDELNLGEFDHGIMILDDKHEPGTPLKKLFDVDTDWIYEIGLTPNRADAMSHYGTARDLRARLLHEGKNLELKTPSVSNFSIDKRTKNIKINIDDNSLTPRYCGIVMENIKIDNSPEWLQNKIISIGLSPINNIVDITNFVMHDLGQPLHAFDYEKIEGETINVKKHNKNIKFKTLDEVEREITKDDLMICNSKKPMCIAGIFGGIDSGVSKETNTIFIESAYFDPISVRKSAKHHNLSTDSSYRFERGIDPNTTKYALKRAVLMIKEICKGSIVSSDLIDLYPKALEDTQIILGFDKIQKIIGQKIEKETIKNIVSSLDIKINSITESNLGLSIPHFRNDVKREADVIEEILRIYGYNNIESSKKVNQTIILNKENIKNKIVDSISNHLVSIGFYEIMTNSLVSNQKNELNKDDNDLQNVNILNFSSADQSQLRNSMIFSGLDVIKYNLNRKKNNLKLFEIGKEYHKSNNGKYLEKEKLSVFIYGDRNNLNWNTQNKKSDFFYLKGVVKSIIKKLGFNSIKAKPLTTNNIQEGETIYYQKSEILSYGIINDKICKKFEINENVLYAELDVNMIIDKYSDQPIHFKKISKFPEVSRDLSILIDKEVRFEDIYKTVRQINQKLIKEISLFDVFQGKNLPDDKKSYGIAFKIQDNDKTLSESEIEGLMKKIISKIQKDFKAELR
jgi:phenylalanyl-tRNA synthetase beta chain